MSGHFARPLTRVTMPGGQAGRDRQAEIQANAAAGSFRDAEAVVWQLADEIQISETGFRGTDGEMFDTFNQRFSMSGTAKRSRSRRFRSRMASVPRHARRPAFATPEAEKENRTTAARATQ